MTTDLRPPPRRGLTRIVDFIVQLGAYCGGFCAVGILVSYSIEVFMRYVMNAPTDWASDFVRYFLCGSVFLMMPQLTAEGSHVAVTVLKGRVPAVVERVAGPTGLVISAAICALVGWLATAQTQYNIAQHVETMSLIAIPKWIVSAPIAFGFVVSTVVLLVQLVTGERVHGVAQS